MKFYGEMKVSDKHGTVVWVWDYTNDKPVKKSELTPEQLKAIKKGRLEYLSKQS